MNPTLIYDGECPVCLRAVAWTKSNIGPHAIDLLPCQDPERSERYPDISRETCMEAMQLVMPDGDVLAGEQALPVLFSMAPRWRWLSLLLRFPGISLATPFIYRWIARHRYAISGLLTRKDGGESCSVDGNCE